MSRDNSERLSAQDILHRLKIQESFEDEYCTNLDGESSDNEDTPEGDFTTGDGQQMLMDCDTITGKGFEMLCLLSTPAE